MSRITPSLSRRSPALAASWILFSVVTAALLPTVGRGHGVDLRPAAVAFLVVAAVGLWLPRVRVRLVGLVVGVAVFASFGAGA